MLLGRTTKQTARLKSLLGLAVTRLAVLRAHRQVRCAQARGDVEQLLRLGHADRALLRAEQVIREQDMLDVFLLLESYCNLVSDRAALVDAAQRDRECPEELREAAAGLVYAAARCGDLPELQEVRALLAAKLGRDFASAAAELRSGCGINTKIVQKLSTKQRSLESRTKVLLEIAAEKEIPVRLPETTSYDHEDSGSSHRRKKKQQDTERHRTPPPAADVEGDDIVSPDSALRYKDVEAAAQAAFESAATAAAAAKAAIELSRADQPGDPDDRYRRKPVGAHMESGKETLHGGEDLADAKKFGRTFGHVRNYSSEVEDLPETEEHDDDIVESKFKHGEQRDQVRSRPASVRTKRGF